MSIFLSKANVDEKILFGKALIFKASKLEKCLQGACINKRIAHLVANLVFDSLFFLAFGVISFRRTIALYQDNIKNFM